MNWIVYQVVTAWICYSVVRGSSGLSAVGNFRNAVVRAQCMASCLEQYGDYKPPGAPWDIYNFYKPDLHCDSLDNNSSCRECLDPCKAIFESLEGCQYSCTTLPCQKSCESIYRIKHAEMITQDVQQSSKAVVLDAVSVSCQDATSIAANEHNAYLRWNVVGVDDLIHSKMVPLTFVVQIRAESNGTHTKWTSFSTRHGWVPVTVNASTMYQFRVIPVLPDGVAGQGVVSDWMRTLPRKVTPGKPKKLFMIQEEVVDGDVYIILGWKPPDDEVCQYNIIVLPYTDLGIQDNQRIGKLPEFKYRYGPLDYGTQYDIHMRSCTSDYVCSEDTATLHLTTMSCLQANQFSYTSCAPESPGRLKVQALPSDQATPGCSIAAVFHWAMPEHGSAINSVLEYQLTWQKIPRLVFNQRASSHYDSAAIPGNRTNYTCEELHPDSSYYAQLVAISEGGKSKPSTVIFNTSAFASNCMEPQMSNKLDEKSLNGSLASSHVMYYVTIPCVLVGLVTILTFVIVNRYQAYKHRTPKASSSNPVNTQRISSNPLYHSVEPSNLSETTIQESESETSDSALRLPGDDYEISFGSLKLGQPIGQGAFGKVVKAELSEAPRAVRRNSWRNVSLPLTVAVKMLKSYPLAEDRMNLRKEMELMKGLGRHPNVVSLVACCTRGPQLALVMDYCPHGDLRNYLRILRERHAPLLNLQRPAKELCSYSSGGTRTTDSGVSNQMSGSNSDRTQTKTPTRRNSAEQQNSADSARATPMTSSDSSCQSTTSPQHCRSTPLSESDFRTTLILDGDEMISTTRLLSFARQTAVGMEYLSQKKFVHRDLAARNILVCEHDLIKISDFGLTRDIYENSAYHKATSGKLPIKWMSIEAIFDQTYTTHSDVWSFGIVLWEIVTLGGSPYPGICSKDLYHLLKDGYRMERPDNCSQEIYGIMLDCWHTVPSERPTFTHLRNYLEVLLSKTAEDASCNYIDLNLQDKEEYYMYEQDNSSSTEIQPYTPLKNKLLKEYHDQTSTSSAESTVILQMSDTHKGSGRKGHRPTRNVKVTKFL